MLSSASVTFERTLPCGVSSLGSTGSFGAGGAACTMNSSSSSPSSVSISWPSTTSGDLVVPLLLDRGGLDVRGAHDRLRVRGLRRLGALGLRLEARELGRRALHPPRRRAHALRRRADDTRDRRAGQQHEARRRTGRRTGCARRSPGRACASTQKRPSPTAPPWWRNQSEVSNAASRGGSSGPSPNVPAASPSMSAVSRNRPPALKGAGVGHHRADHEHRPGGEQRDRDEVADAAEEPDEAVRERLAHLAAVPAEVEDEARRRPLQATRPRPSTSFSFWSSTGSRGAHEVGTARARRGPAPGGLAARGLLPAAAGHRRFGFSTPRGKPLCGPSGPRRTIARP